MQSSGTIRHTPEASVTLWTTKQFVAQKSRPYWVTLSRCYSGIGPPLLASCNWRTFFPLAGCWDRRGKEKRVMSSAAYRGQGTDWLIESGSAELDLLLCGILFHPSSHNRS